MLQSAAPSFTDAVKTWARIGILSFGGPTAQIALMHKVTVDEKKWLSEEQYLSALSFCMLLPGPEAMQLATYVGWRLHGVMGGLAAGLLFILPGAFVVLALATIYAAFGNVPLVENIFFGIKAAVLVIVIEALLRLTRRALHRAEHWVLAGISFIAIFFFALPFPLIVFAAALWGYFRPSTATAAQTADQPQILARPRQTALTIVKWLAVWLVPLTLVFLVLGADHVLSQISLFFSKLAVVTFGGAYAVLAYMAQDVVQHHGWLSAGQMLDGLGLAETTPGPLILVTEFVGFLAAFQSGQGYPWIMGPAGAAIALWSTFAPCFLWIFAGAPYIEWITHQPKLKGALTGITAAVVGVMLNLAVWFALHVFFANVKLTTLGPVHIWQPELATLDWRVVLLAVISAILLLKLKWSILHVLVIASALALAIRTAGL